MEIVAVWKGNSCQTSTPSYLNIVIQNFGTFLPVVKGGLLSLKVFVTFTHESGHIVCHVINCTAAYCSRIEARDWSLPASKERTIIDFCMTKEI